MADESLSLFNSRFVANIDFTQAVRDADTLDRQIDRVAQGVRHLGTAGVAHLNAFNAALARTAQSMGLLLSPMGGVIGGGRGPIALPGVGALHTPPPLMLPPGFVRQPSYAQLPTATPWQGGMVHPALPFAPTRWGQANAPWQAFAFERAQPMLLPPAQVVTPQRVTTGPVSYVVNPQGFTVPRYSAGASGAALIPHPTLFGGGGGGGMPPGFPGSPYNPPPGGFNPMWIAGQGFTGMPNMRSVLGPGALFRAAGDMWHDYYGMGARRLSAGLMDTGRFFSPQNMMRAASVLYLGQGIANMGRFVGNATIGQAQFLEERQELLENALMSPRYNIDRQQAERWASNLTGGSFFAGMPVSAAEMGLSRVELAEQFRQLSPIIRLTADTRAEFQSGLQTGALARALLVARDPVQGTQGATVALSELYSGGADRFRSLSLRFEIPRNRLREIEAEMGGPDQADPGQVVIQMLREMGFGPEYLERRAATLSGQFGRAGALWANFRIEMFDEAMSRVRDNLTALNDTFESFLASDAGDRFLDWVDQLFGSVTGFLTQGPMNMMIRMFAREGAVPPGRLGRDIADYMPSRGGRFLDAEGATTDAATAFREAAEVISGRAVEQALRMPQYMPGSALATQGLGLTIGGIAATGLIDRMLFRGAMGNAARVAGAQGLAAAAPVAAAGIGGAVGLAVPLAIIGGGAFATAGFMQTRSALDDWRQFAAAHPDIAAQFGIPNDMGAGAMFAERMGAWSARTARFLDVGRHIWGDWGGNPLIPNETEPTTFERITTSLPMANAVAQLQQYGALAMIGGEDPATVEENMRAMLSQMAAENPAVARNLGEYGDILQTARRVLDPNDRSAAGQVLATTALWRAATADQNLMLGDERIVENVMERVGREGENLGSEALSLWQNVLARAGGDQDEAISLLMRMLETMVGIEGNTRDAADALSPYGGIRPSGAGDIFTGFTLDPDMRMVRRTGTPIEGLGSATSASGAASEHIADHAAPYQSRSFGNFVGGTVTSAYGMRGERFHHGIDYVSDDGMVRALMPGTVEYLATDEDYARYAHMFPGGRRVYGNTALLHDEAGASVIAYSHLDDSTFARFAAGAVEAGEELGVMGATGQVRSSHGGSGAHVHQEFWMRNAQGEFEKVNPALTEEWVNRGLPALHDAEHDHGGEGGTVNINLGGMTFEIPAGSPEQMIDDILDSGALRQMLVDALADGLARDPVAAERIVSQAERGRNRRGTSVG